MTAFWRSTWLVFVIAQGSHGSQVAFELSDGTTPRLIPNASVVQKRGSRSPANSVKDSETLTNRDIPDGLLEDTVSDGVQTLRE